MLASGVNQAPVLLPINAYYAAPVDSMPGDGANGFQAFVVFNHRISYTGLAQHVIGNLDVGNNAGWRVFVDTDNQVKVDVGGGGTITTYVVGDLAGAYAALMVTYDASIQVLRVEVNGRTVINATLAAYTAPSGTVCSLFYDVNGAREQAQGVSIAGFGYNVGPAMIAGTFLWDEVGLSNGVNLPAGNAFPVTAAITAVYPNLVAYRVIYDNDGAHPPLPVQSGNNNIAATSWRAYTGTGPTFTKGGTVTQMYVVTTALPWAQPTAAIGGPTGP
jgi:hypothetical protein